jgi:hypothetical protein
MNPTFTSGGDTPIVRGTRLATSGHDQIVIKCPGCGEMHRHLGLGVRRGPCGLVYLIRLRATRPRPVHLAPAAS